MGGKGECSHHKEINGDMMEVLANTMVIIILKYIFNIYIALISHASKVMLKILPGRLHQNQKLPDVQARFRKGRDTREQVVSVS